MPLAIVAVPEFPTHFEARIFPIFRAPSGPILGGQPSAGHGFFGVCLFTVIAYASYPVILDSVVVDSSRGEFHPYGPTREFFIFPGQTIPIGVWFRRWPIAEEKDPASATVTFTYRDFPYFFNAQVSVELVATIVVDEEAFFIPDAVELIASGARSKALRISLLCGTQVDAFTSSPPLPATSAFSEGGLPLGLFPPQSEPVVTFNFDSNPGRDRSPQFVTLTATGPGSGPSSVPIICWTAQTVLPNQLAITSIVADPPGPDLPNELVTISNVTDRNVDLTGCTLLEARDGHSFGFPAGFVLRAGALVTVHTGKGTNSGSDLFWGRTQPAWHNDSDTGIVFNLAGDPVATNSYFFAADGAPIPGQTPKNTLVWVDQGQAWTFTGANLEDGDRVVLFPVLSSRSFSGDFGIGPTGPGGAPNALAPDDDNPPWPFPGAPKFALLAEAGGVVLVGATPMFSLVVDGPSALKANLPLNLLINDKEPGGPFANGGYLVVVQVWRK